MICVGPLSFLLYRALESELTKTVLMVVTGTAVTSHRPLSNKSQTQACFQTVASAADNLMSEDVQFLGLTLIPGNPEKSEGSAQSNYRPKCRIFEGARSKKPGYMGACIKQ